VFTLNLSNSLKQIKIKVDAKILSKRYIKIGRF